ncbi:hypothetical protein D3C87_2090940 [compost metagenome]
MEHLQVIVQVADEGGGDPARLLFEAVALAFLLPFAHPEIGRDRDGQPEARDQHDRPVPV